MGGYASDMIRDTAERQDDGYKKYAVWCVQLWMRAASETHDNECGGSRDAGRQAR